MLQNVEYIYSELFNGVTKWLVFLLCSRACMNLEKKNSAFYSEIVYFYSIV